MNGGCLKLSVRKPATSTSSPRTQDSKPARLRPSCSPSSSKAWCGTTERIITFSDRALRHFERRFRGWPPTVLDRARSWCLTFRPVRGANTAALDCTTFPLCQHPPCTETLSPSCLNHHRLNRAAPRRNRRTPRRKPNRRLPLLVQVVGDW